MLRSRPLSTMAEDFPFYPPPANPANPPSASPSEDPTAAFREAITDAVEFEHEEEQVEQSAFALVFVIGVIVLLAGVGAWHFLRSFPSEGTPMFPPTPLTAELQKDPNLIVAAIGGTIISPYGAQVHVPAGALQKNKRIEIERVTQGPVTDQFHLKPDGTKFLKPVTVAIPYKGEPEDILLEYWFTSGGRKQLLKYEVDASVKKLRTKIMQF